MDLRERVAHLRKNMELVLPEDYAITFCYAILNQDLKLSYINGGHPAPIVYMDGETKFLKGMSPMIMGINFAANDEVQTVQLKNRVNVFYVYRWGK